MGVPERHSGLASFNGLNGVRIRGGSIATGTASTAGGPVMTGLTFDASSATANGLSGVLLDGVASAADITIRGASAFNSNGQSGFDVGHGFAVVGSTLNDLVIDAATLNGNDGDGLHFENSTVSEVDLVGGGYASNTGNGIAILGGTLAPRDLTMFPTSFGMRATGTTIQSNQGHGILIAALGGIGATVRDLTLTTTTITLNGAGGAALSGSGIRVEGSTLRDLEVNDSDITSNDGDGISAAGSILSDVFVHSDSAIDSNARAGINVSGGSLLPETGVAGSFSLKVQSSRINSNGAQGILLSNMTARGITVTSSNILSNGAAAGPANGAGILVSSSTLNGLLLTGTSVSLNTGDGIRATNATLTDIVAQALTLINANTGAGIQISGGTIGPETGVMGSLGLKITSSAVSTNGLHGIWINGGAVARTVSVEAGSIITGNGTAAGALNGSGIQVDNSTMRGLVVDSSAVSTNDGDGISAQGANSVGHRRAQHQHREFEQPGRHPHPGRQDRARNERDGQRRAVGRQRLHRNERIARHLAPHDDRAGHHRAERKCHQVEWRGGRRPQRLRHLCRRNRIDRPAG